MTVVDVNTGKFTGKGGNLEETVTSNNLEAAEEIVRQLRLRDVGGIIVVDFIDMVLESNRELVLRRLTECLGRDRTKHQVAEVTSARARADDPQAGRPGPARGLQRAVSHLRRPWPHHRAARASAASKPKPKPIPRPPLPRPLDEDGNEIPPLDELGHAADHGERSSHGSKSRRPQPELEEAALRRSRPAEADGRIVDVEDACRVRGGRRGPAAAEQTPECEALVEYSARAWRLPIRWAVVPLRRAQLCATARRPAATQILQVPASSSIQRGR